MRKAACLFPGVFLLAVVILGVWGGSGTLVSQGKRVGAVAPSWLYGPVLLPKGTNLRVCAQNFGNEDLGLTITLVDGNFNLIDKFEAPFPPLISEPVFSTGTTFCSPTPSSS